MKKKVLRYIHLIIMLLALSTLVILGTLGLFASAKIAVANADTISTSDSASETDSISKWGGTSLNGATILTPNNNYLTTRTYETGVDDGFDVSSGYERNVLEEHNSFANFFIDTLGTGGEVLKSANQYGGVDAYGFVAGSGEPVYKTNDDGKKILIGYNSVAIKLHYNYDSTNDLRGSDGRDWSINNDSWKGTVNGMSPVGPIGNGAVIVQKFVPTSAKAYPTENSDWKRLNEFSDNETDGLHTVNFFEEHKPAEGRDSIVVYQPKGEDLQKGVFIKLTVVYELVHTDTKTGWEWWDGLWTGDWNKYTYKNVVEETTFYLCNTSGEIVFENLYYTSQDAPSGEQETKQAETGVTKTAGEIVQNQGSSEGFRLDTRGSSYDVKYYLNDSSNALSCKDGDVFHMPGKYEFVVTTKIGVVRKKTVYIHEVSEEQNIETYFGTGLIAEGRRVFSPFDNYPVYLEGTVSLQTQDENRSTIKHAPLVGKVFLLSGDWNEGRENGLPQGELISEKTADNRSWYLSDLTAGNYEAIFANNEAYFEGEATGDTYTFVWRFSIIKSEPAPVVNEELLYLQIGVSDYASMHYEVALRTEGIGKAVVCFANEIEAYNFANEYLVSTVNALNGEYIFDGKTYKSEREMLTDLHARARSMVKKAYFDLTDESTFVTLKDNLILPEKSTEDTAADNYKFDSILKRNLTQNVFIFSQSFYESIAVGEPFLNDRVYSFYDLEEKKITISNGKNSVHFVSVGNFESESVTLISESDNSQYTIPYGIDVESYLELKNAPTGRYKVVETNENGSTASYYAIYIKKGDIRTKLKLIRTLNNSTTKHLLNEVYNENSENNDYSQRRLRANNVILESATNTFDPYGIVKILRNGQSFAIYQLDEVQNICIDEEGNYEIILVDRLGNSTKYYVDIYSASKIYSFSMKDGAKTIFSDYAFGGKSFALEQLQSANEDYEFAGWQDEYGNLYKDTYTFNTPRDVVLTAVWYHTKVTISVYNGSALEKYSKKVGEMQVLPELKKDGYTLYGYSYMQPDGTIRFYKGQINSVPNVRSMRLDAVWVKNETIADLQEGTEDEVVVSLINGSLVDTFIAKKGEQIELSQLEKENGLIFAGWLYQYELVGTILTDDFNYEEIKHIGNEYDNAVKLTAIWYADPDVEQTPFVGGATSSSQNTNNILRMVGGFISENGYSVTGIMLAVLLLAVLYFARKRIKACILSLKEKVNLKRQALVVQSSVSENTVYSQNYDKHFAVKKAKRSGIHFGSPRKFYARIIFPCVIFLLCLVFLFQSQTQLFSGISNRVRIANAESAIAKISEEDNEADERALGVSLAYQSLNDAYEDDLTASEQFLYSNILVDLLSMGYEDVFAAHAITNDKIVNGIGYTAYVDAYEENVGYIFGAGFVSLADENHITQEDVENGVKIVIDESESDYYEYTEFKLTFNQSWGPLHYVAYKQYVQYQVTDYIVQCNIVPDDGTYNDALGEVYDYDIGEVCHYTDYRKDFELNAYGLTSDVDYDTLVQAYVERINEQMNNAVSVNVEKADFISAQALNDYLANNQAEEFLGLDAETILYYEAHTADTQYYIIRADGKIDVLDLPPDPVRQASIFQRIAIGVAAIGGAVLGVVACAIPGVGPMIGGALISASIDIFMQVTVCGTAPENIDWVSVGVSAVCGAITGGIGSIANAATTAAVKLAETAVEKILIKVGVQFVAGLFSGGISYLTSASLKGEEISFKDCMQSMCIGGFTGALTCLVNLPLENITTKLNGAIIALQIINGALSGALSYMITIGITGAEFSWQAFGMAAAMGATMATVTVIGGKLIKIINVSRIKRIETERKYQEYCKGEYKEFKSYSEFKKEYGKAGEGYEWHHIVEQNQIKHGTATPEQIYNTKNTIRLDYDSHREISGIYSSKPAWAGGLTVRQWMATQPYEVQMAKGIELLKSIGIKV